MKAVYTTIANIPTNDNTIDVTHLSDSQDIAELRQYVPNGKQLVSAFVLVRDGDYVTIWADYEHSIPYLTNEVRVIDVQKYIHEKIQRNMKRNRK